MNDNEPNPFLWFQDLAAEMGVRVENADDVDDLFRRYAAKLAAEQDHAGLDQLLKKVDAMESAAAGLTRMWRERN
jgi:hypothetical protein